MSRLALVVALLAASTGCARYTLAMRQTDDAMGPDYVLLRQKGNIQRVFDCYSRPDGETWRPVCVRVQFTDKPVSAERRTDRVEGRTERFDD